jgi:hypothetical protein
MGFSFMKNEMIYHFITLVIDHFITLVIDHFITLVIDPKDFRFLWKPLRVISYLK